MAPDPDHVADDEEQYRSIRPELLVIESGVLRARSEAFGDRGQRVSVDRALLIDNEPRRARRGSTDAVAWHPIAGLADLNLVSLVAEGLAAIGVVPPGG